ncbi:MAG: hypothetical protein B7Z03_09805 [Hydrogenophilales bacterium 32-62-9]|nr:MAG: hypothetical protein B7Z03_09805 [Hydrogenophilales bacterium 32-62-9]
MKRLRILWAGLAWLAAADVLSANGPAGFDPGFSASEARLIHSLEIGKLGAPPADAGNRVADNPEAAALGRQLFFDPRFSRNGQVSCASCHQPAFGFSDPAAQSRGMGKTARNSMTLLGAAWQNWYFWDGSKDSLWAQALAPIESASEHGLDRMAAVRLLAEHYPAPYESVFGTLPDLRDGARFPARASPLGDAAARRTWQRMAPADRRSVSQAFANLGKSIAAWQRTLVLAPSRFDRYATALARKDTATMRATLSTDEAAGLRLFIGRANCIHCHNGPLFSNGEFHATGVRFSAGADDAGRTRSVLTVRKDEFNCLGPYSDAQPEACAALRFLPTSWPGKPGAFKVPTLRNVSRTAPYMRTGEMASLRAVLEHYNAGSRIARARDRTEIVALHLTSRELDQIVAFLGTLDSEVSERPSPVRAVAHR